MRKLSYSQHLDRRPSRAVGVALLFVLGACNKADTTTSDFLLDAGHVSDVAVADAAQAPLDAGRPSDDLSSDTDPVQVAPLADVEVVITTDNAFSFGYGDARSVSTFLQGEA